MIDKILELSLGHRAFVLLATLALVGVGLWSASHLPIDAVPDITGVQVQINTEVRTLAAEESERFVTWPIEIQMAGLPGLEEMRSLTKFGLSQVTLQFDDNTDIYRARQLVTERLQAAVEHLPHDVAPKLAPISTGLGEIFYYTFPTSRAQKNRNWVGINCSSCANFMTTPSSHCCGPCPVLPRLMKAAATNDNF